MSMALISHAVKFVILLFALPGSMMIGILLVEKKTCIFEINTPT